MALLTPARRSVRVGAVVAALMCGSCHGGSNMGTIALELYEQPVRCETNAARCVGPDGKARTPTSLRTWVFASAGTSRFHPHGLYVYFELARPGDRRAHVELDIPTRGEAKPRFSYLERGGDFEADAMTGRIEIAREWTGKGECACLDGRLELTFVDFGPDGKRGTSDDRHRRLSRARFTTGDGFCVGPTTLPTDGESTDVLVVERCPDPEPREETSRRTGRRGDWSSSEETDVDGYDTTTTTTSCEGDPERSTTDSGCNSDGGSSGCEGDTGGGSASGCEGDTGGGSGCAGDSGGGGCGGDTAARAGTGDRPARAGMCAGTAPEARWARRWWNRLQPLLWIVLGGMHQRRRAARRRRPFCNAPRRARIRD